MRTKAISDEALASVLGALTTANRLVCRVALATGLRVSDVLGLKPEQVEKGRFTVQEQKTGKRRTVTIPPDLVRAVLVQAGAVYCFPHRLDGRRHRTRQAVWKDLRRAARALRMKGGLGTHSMRKTFAKRLYAKKGLSAVQRTLCHSSATITALYAMADEVQRRG